MKKTPRSFRILVHSLLGAALTSATAFSVAPEELDALRAKAETGDAIAQHNLGLIYANPQESVSDLVEAYAWLNLAADNGATGRSLMIVTKQMNAEQIDEGKRRVEQIREALAAKRRSGGAALVTQSPAPHRAAAASPVSAPAPAPNPVSASPIVPAAVPVADEAAQAELKKISAELASAWQEIDQLKTAAAGAATTGATLKTERDQLARALENSTREIAELKAGAANFEGERNGLLKKLADAQKTSDGESRLKLVAAETELSALKNQLADATKKLAAGATATTELAAAQNRVSSLEADTTRLTAEKSELSQKLAAAVAPEEMTRVTRESSELKDRVASSQQALALATAEIASLKQELKSARTGVVPAAQLEELQSRLAAAAQSAALAREAAAAELEKTRAERARVASELTAANLAATKEVAELKAGAANFEGERNGLLEKISAERALAERAQAELETLKSQLTVAKTSAGDSARLSEELARVSGELAELKKTAADDQQAFAAARAETDALKQQLAAANDNHAREKANAAELAQAISAAQDSAAAQLAALKTATETQHSELRAQVNAAEAARASASEEASALRAQLAEARAGADRELGAKAIALETELANTKTLLVEAERQTAANAELLMKLTADDEAAAALRAERDSLAQRIATLEQTPPPPASLANEENLQPQLDETNAKLAAALRSFETQEEELSRVRQSLAAAEKERATLAERVELSARQLTEANERAATSGNSAQEIAALREQLRNAQAQASQLATENGQLRNRGASVSAPATSPTALIVLSPPQRPGSNAASSASRVASGSPRSNERFHTVAEGETLSHIARLYYGNAERWADIYDANRTSLPNPATLRIGQRLRIP
jgi:nucleoid-associated protein YgaU